MGSENHPGARLRQLLEERGWSQDDLAQITGKRRQTISAVVSGRATITPEMAVVLGAAFGNQPAEWLQWSADYELEITEATGDDVQRRARLYCLAPIKEMTKRGWIPLNALEDDDKLESSLTKFFGGSLQTAFPIAARRTATLETLTLAEKAWCFRARLLAQSILAEEFSRDRLPAVEQKLRKAAAYPKDSGRVAKILSEAGIRFVIVEPLPGAKIDGASFWLDECSPVIALSLRYDRVDTFWFTLFHEFAHIKHGDALSVDIDVFHETEGGISVALAEVEQEKKANDAASESLIPQAEMESFIRRLSPYYSSERIIQFAHKVQIHPGIIVGQLQHRREIGFHALRDFLVKIRATVTETALTDGWGHISPELG